MTRCACGKPATETHGKLRLCLNCSHALIALFTRFEPTESTEVVEAKLALVDRLARKR